MSSGSLFRRRFSVRRRRSSADARGCAAGSADPLSGPGAPAASGGLFRKYVTVIVLLVGASLVLSGAVQLYTSYQESQGALRRIQQEQAATAAAKIAAFVHGTETQLGWAIPPPAVGEVAFEVRRAGYLRLLAQDPSVTEVRYLDATGRERLRVSRLAPSVVDSGTDLSRDPRFTSRRVGRVSYGTVYFRGDSEPYLSVAVAEASSGGVTVAEVNLKFILDVVAPITVGRAGHAYVVDGVGQLVAHPDLSLVLRRTDLAGLAQVRAAVGDGAPARGAMVASDSNGRGVLTSFERVVPPGWAVFVEQPLDEAVAPLRAVLLQDAFVVLAGALLAAFAATLLARRMIVPIRALQTSAARIGAGELDHRIEIQTGDELEALAMDFNRMTERLQDSHATLELKVAERTSDLAASLEANARLLGQIEEKNAQLAGWNLTLEERVRDQVGEIERMSRLRRFLAPQVAELLLSSGDDSLLEGHRREITVVFCDLRGFTPFSETAEPEEVFAVLREYHDAMGELIHRFEGTLEHFAGDGMMVFFNDPIPCPDPQARAVAMAVAMRERVGGLGAAWRERGHDLGLGIGIASGYATLGQIGFAGRSEYGAIGSVVNLTSRLCSEATGGQILVDHRVYTATKVLADAEFVGELRLKGFTKPVPTYSIVRLAAGMPVTA